MTAYDALKHMIEGSATQADAPGMVILLMVFLAIAVVGSAWLIAIQGDRR